MSGAMNDIVKENYWKLVELLADRENWFPEEAGEDGSSAFCFGVHGAGRLTVIPEMDGFLVQIPGQEKPRVIPRIESVREWLDEHEQQYAGLTATQEEWKEALERARERRGEAEA